MKKVRGVLIWLASLLLVLGLSITANAADELTGTANMSAFKDIAANDQALPFVNYLVGKEIIKGYPDGTFHPKSGLTRTEAAVVICKAAGITIDKSSVSSFKDVNRIYWAKDYINKAAQAGYIKGNPDKTFRPEQELTRAEGISLIFRLSQSDISQAALPSLTDINNGHWAAKPIAAALAAGMVGLSPDGKKFMPDAPFTRINLAQALGSLLTEDPSLYQTSLPGCLKPITGQITIKRTGSQQEESVDKETNVSVGDTITSVKGAKAEIDYPDGSSLLIKDATQITVKAAEGRKYIKTNGSEG
ncbi:MAG: S-layer homology domain-containing protein, partial [Methylocystaceae bacterium]